jgi:Bacteriocin-protection, YdeI or OmpD-Associated/Domain of unknown function (DUF1905)
MKVELALETTSPILLPSPTVIIEHVMAHADQPYIFSARIQKIWIMRCVDVPRDVSKAFRSLAGENALRIPVHGWIEGLPFKSTMVPRGGGCYRLHIHSRIWRKLRIDAGAVVEVAMLLDSEPREVPLPPDLAAGLAETPRALATFNSLTPAFRRQIVIYMDAAKQSRTREKRVQLIVKRMLERARRRKKEPEPKKKPRPERERKSRQ